MPRYLTKSRFKVGHECPTRLYYLDRKNEYANQDSDDPFLEALAEGGFQVGALAQAYFPEGFSIETMDHDEAVRQTNELLQRENVVIFEAAIRHENCFIRIDALEKRGNQYRLIEVKAKSYDPEEDAEFLKKKDLAFKANWEPYLLDVAFQTWVLRKAFPGAVVHPVLMLADKSAQTTIDGLNQLFLVTKTGAGRIEVRKRPDLVPGHLGARILREVPVTHEVDKAIYEMRFDGNRSFEEWALYLSTLAASGEKSPALVRKECKDCPFRAGPSETALKDGFMECWREMGILTPENESRPMVWNLWDNKRAEGHLRAGIYFLDELEDADLNSKSKPKKNPEPGLERVQRQLLQVEMVKSRQATPYIDREGLRAELDSWMFPLHFIDFETTRVAIPFNREQRPYEGIAFQFSHHVVHEDGRIEHKTQYLDRDRGKFPNFDFVRALRAALSGNDGTILRYSPHENTVLREIRRQLLGSQGSSVRDRGELVAWIEEITQPSEEEASATGAQAGRRNMVDLWIIVKKFYLSPLMGGSNSIKVVLPSVLAESRYLQEKYSRPIYGGSAAEIASLNFNEPKAWLQFQNGKILNPYSQLSPIAPDIPDDETVMRLMPHEQIAEGGAAMIAFAKMQFSEMSDREREEICQALLRYCELDTLAMVMIYEYFREKSRRHS